ncbi:hypothetical protein ACS0TY_030124 [Phlomoides rotata]
MCCVVIKHSKRHESEEQERYDAKYDSNLDQTFPLPFDILFAFQTNSSLIKVGVDVGGILKQSLSKALEVYYPLAGRLKVGRWWSIATLRAASHFPTSIWETSPRLIAH